MKKKVSISPDTELLKQYLQEDELRFIPSSVDPSVAKFASRAKSHSDNIAALIWYYGSQLKMFTALKKFDFPQRITNDIANLREQFISRFGPDADASLITDEVVEIKITFSDSRIPPIKSNATILKLGLFKRIEEVLGSTVRTATKPTSAITDVLRNMSPLASFLLNEKILQNKNQICLFIRDIFNDCWGADVDKKFIHDRIILPPKIV